MSIVRFLILVSVFTFFCGCGSKIVVKQLSNVTPGQAIKKEIANGSLYALPNTVVRVQLKVNKVTRQGAPYSEFASIFVPGADVVCQNRSYAQRIADAEIKLRDDAAADAAAIAAAAAGATAEAQARKAEHDRANAEALAEANANAAAGDKANTQSVDHASTEQRTKSAADIQALQAAQNTGTVQQIADATALKAADDAATAQAVKNTQDKALNDKQDVTDAKADPDKFNQAQAKIKFKVPVCGNDKFSLQQGATFSTYGEPDPDNVFLVKWVGKGAIDQNLSMTWTEAGVATAASSTVTNRTGDVILSTAKLVAGLGTKAALGITAAGGPHTNCLDRQGNSVYDPEHDWILDRLVAEQGPLAIPNDIYQNLVGNYCGMDKEDRAGLPQYNDGNVNLLHVALIAYLTNFSPLNNGKGKIFGGTSPSGDTLNLLTRIETELTTQTSKFFTGTKKTVSWDGMVDVRALPTATALSTAAQDIPILSLNPSKGFCLGNAEIPAESKPYPDEFKGNILTGAECTAASPVNLNVSYFPKLERQLFSRVQDIPDDEKSFRYRIPAQIRADLNFHDGTYGSGVFFVGQLGTVLSLPATRHSKQLSYDLTFIEQTGGLKTFKLGSVGILDTSTIDALSGIGGTLIDAHNKTSDDLNRLTKQDQLLKLQDDICTIQKKYGITCTIQP